MPNVSIKDIQSAIADSMDLNTYNGEESSSGWNSYKTSIITGRVEYGITKIQSDSDGTLFEITLPHQPYN